MRGCQVRLVDDQKICLFFSIPVWLAKSDVAAHNSPRPFGFISFKQKPANAIEKEITCSHTPGIYAEGYIALSFRLYNGENNVSGLFTFEYLPWLLKRPHLHIGLRWAVVALWATCSNFLVRILQYHVVILSLVHVNFQKVTMHKADAARLKRQVPKLAKSHQCKVNGDFMQQIRSNELEWHVNSKMLNGKEWNADFYCFRMSTLDLCEKWRKVSVFLWVQT